MDSDVIHSYLPSRCQVVILTQTRSETIGYASEPQDFDLHSSLNSIAFADDAPTRPHPDSDLRAILLFAKKMPMTKITRGSLISFLTVVLLLLGLPFISHGQSKFVTRRGKEFISPNGNPLLLRGINLGNWLLPEGYMFKFKTANSPRLIQSVVNELIGEDEARRFWKAFREHYITREDIRFIKQSGFNSVRVPFSYRLFVSEGEQQKLEGPGYELLDQVVAWCKQEGLSVVLDMHGAPGGQTGDNIDDSWGYPFLFESAESQELTINIWRKIAARFRNEPAVLGYYLLNKT